MRSSIVLSFVLSLICLMMIPVFAGFNGCYYCKNGLRIKSDTKKFYAELTESLASPNALESKCKNEFALMIPLMRIDAKFMHQVAKYFQGNWYDPDKVFDAGFYYPDTAKENELYNKFTAAKGLQHTFESLAQKLESTCKQEQEGMYDKERVFREFKMNLDTNGLNKNAEDLLGFLKYRGVEAELKLLSSCEITQ